MQNKKILFIHHGQVIGGAPRSLKNTIIGLEKEGFTNLKILCAYPDMKSFFQEGTNVKVGDIYSPHLLIGRVFVGLSSLTNVRALIGVIFETCKAPMTIYRQMKVLKQEAPDIVHLNSSILFLVAISAKLMNIPLVWHVREVLIGSKWNVRKRFAGWFIRKLADKVICISEMEASSLGYDEYKNVNTIYNFIDFSGFNIDNIDIEKEKNKYGLDTKKVVISLGGVSFRKGTVEIIQAAVKSPDTMFLIAGTFPKNSHYVTLTRGLISTVHKLENILKNIGLKNIYSWYYNQRVEFMFFKLNLPNLLFVGKLENVAPLIAISDCLLFTGCTPHFPRPVYEAWSMEKPVVVFDMHGVSENIDESIDGIITKSNDSAGLIDAIQSVSANMGENGYAKAMEKFDMKKNVKKIIKVYGEL